MPRRESKQELEELDDGEVADPDGGPDLFTSPVGGGGFIGKWLKKMLGSAAPVRREAAVDRRAPIRRRIARTRRTAARTRCRRLATVASDDGADVTSGGVTYPEWDVNRKALPPGLVHGARGRSRG